MKPTLENKRGVCRSTTGGAEPPTTDLRKSKRSTYVVKSGQRCVAGNLLLLSFLFKFSRTNLLRGIVVRLLINYHRVVAKLVSRVVWDHGAAGSNPAYSTIISQWWSNGSSPGSYPGDEVRFLRLLPSAAAVINYAVVLYTDLLFQLPPT